MGIMSIKVWGCILCTPQCDYTSYRAMLDNIWKNNVTGKLLIIPMESFKLELGANSSLFFVGLWKICGHSYIFLGRTPMEMCT